jgi:NTE family protein
MGDVKPKFDPAGVFENAPPRRIGLALSGGGARAIAFHLGCLRALHDRGVLPQVSIISAVSGGAVITALYAYGGEKDFGAFDQRVVALLRRGLAGRIARRALLSSTALRALGTSATAGVTALATTIVRVCGGALATLSKSSTLKRRMSRLQPPLRRTTSRTTALEEVLSDVIGGATLPEVQRPNLHVVFNACELRSGSAFRFGSRESGCWRYGRLVSNSVPVKHAVAASAAYPAFLPAIDRTFTFVGKQGAFERRVLLTDGGVFENLGVSCLEPGRSEAFSTNVFPVDYIISCDAGQGLLDDTSIPYAWPGRMARAFESVFRKVQNATYARLYKSVANGELQGAVMVYLGQQDDSLPMRPPELVARARVKDYPTDFSPMSDEDIEALSLRGEQLARMLVAHYCPEL